MLRFVIGVGTRSMPGCDIERELASFFEPGEYEVNPVRQNEESICFQDYLCKRAKHFALRQKSHTDADIYIGIASGLNAFLRNSDKQLGVAYAEAAYIVGEDGTNLFKFLNPKDINEQMLEQRYRMTSHDESFATLVRLVREHCHLQSSSSRS